VPRAASSASAIVDSVWPATSSRMLFGKMRCCRTDLQPKAAQHSAQAHLDVMVLGLQQFASR
jgi:hypothetical protein